MINTCKLNPCCGDMIDCSPPAQPRTRSSRPSSRLPAEAPREVASLPDVYSTAREEGMEQAYQAAARMLHGTSADIGVGELDRIVRGAVSAFLACQPPARREVRMWLVEHEWKPRADTLRAGGATSYHDAKYTTEAQVDAELTRLRALPNGVSRD